MFLIVNLEKLLPCLVLYPPTSRNSSVFVSDSVSVNFEKISLISSASRGIILSLQAFRVFPSRVTVETLSDSYPVGVIPPSQRPVLAS